MVHYFLIDRIIYRINLLKYKISRTCELDVEDKKILDIMLSTQNIPTETLSKIAEVLQQNPTTYDRS